MHKLRTIALVLMASITSYSQEKNIETKSVTLDNLISFIVENYRIETDSTKTKHITLLVETYAENFNIEDKVIFKQAFKLLSKRLKKQDLISVVTYSNLNGLMLSKAKAIEIKKLLYVIENPKASLKTLGDDGIEIAYKFADENFVEDSENTVVMIRIPNRKSEAKKEVTQATRASNKKSNAVILTAISLLPELITIIKD